LPTFVSNHDAGRLAHYVRKAFPTAKDDEVLKRVMLAHAMMFTLRGVPVLYSGDEQGFAGDGIDQDAREDMFPSRVAVYNDNRLVATDATTAQSNFDRGHPLFRGIAELARLRREHSALRRGRQLVRSAADKPGLFAASRIDPPTGREILVAFNTSTASIQANVEVDPRSTAFTSLYGQCEPHPTAAGVVRVALAGLSYLICSAGDAR
jgi:glycosidase